MLHLVDGFAVFKFPEFRHAPMLQRPGMQEILVDGSQLVRQLNVEVFDYLGVAPEARPAIKKLDNLASDSLHLCGLHCPDWEECCSLRDDRLCEDPEYVPDYQRYWDVRGIASRWNEQVSSTTPLPSPVVITDKLQLFLAVRSNEFRTGNIWP